MRLLLRLLLTSAAGCATVSPYWVKVAEPVAHTAILTVAEPCGRKDLDGCARRDTGVIELRAGMDQMLRWCVLNHELKHLAGYDHPIGPHYATDCGDGVTVLTR